MRPSILLQLTLSDSCIHTLEVFPWQKRPTYTTKETNKHDKRDQKIWPKIHLHILFCSSHFPTLASTLLRFSSDKRDLHSRQKRPTFTTKETNKHYKRDQHTRQKRPTNMTKYTPAHFLCASHFLSPASTPLRFSSDKIDLHTRQKRPTNMTKETNIYDKRDQQIWQKISLHILFCASHFLSPASTSLRFTSEKRDLYTWQKTYKHGKRNQRIRQNRPECVTKENNKRDKRDLRIPKETNIHDKRVLNKYEKRDLYTRQMRPTCMIQRDRHTWQKRPIISAASVEFPHPHPWGSLVTGDAYIYDKRDLPIWQKRPTYLTKETHYFCCFFWISAPTPLRFSSDRRHLHIWQKRPTNMTKETCIRDKRDPLFLLLLLNFRTHTLEVL